MKPVKSVFGLLVAALIGYELYALATPDGGDTISEIIWHATDLYPILIFLGGLVCGHFFWPRKK